MPFWRDRSRKQNLWIENRANKNGLRKKVYEVNGDHYEGEWKDNLKHGKGKEVLHNGYMYEGDWEKGKKHGYGILSVPVNNVYVRKYAGQWKQNTYHGAGMLIYAPNEFYEGAMKRNLRDGWGRMHWANGDAYEGEWKNNLRHGRGIQEYANGNWVQCHWQEDRKHGLGKYYFPNSGQLLKGLWVQGICKAGTMEDLNRENASKPTILPIPQCELQDIEDVVTSAQDLLGDLKYSDV